jgi:hypothetical protein
LKKKRSLINQESIPSIQYFVPKIIYFEVGVMVEKQRTLETQFPQTVLLMMALRKPVILEYSVLWK